MVFHQPDFKGKIVKGRTPELVDGIVTTLSYRSKLVCLTTKGGVSPQQVLLVLLFRRSYISRESFIFVDTD